METMSRENLEQGLEGKLNGWIHCLPSLDDEVDEIIQNMTRFHAGMLLSLIHI